jgi:hypothetical protein
VHASSTRKGSEPSFQQRAHLQRSLQVRFGLCNKFWRFQSVLARTAKSKGKAATSFMASEKTWHYSKCHDDIFIHQKLGDPWSKEPTVLLSKPLLF